MLKKAGVIVGVFIILLAGGIYWFAVNMDKKEGVGESKTSTSSYSEKNKTLNSISEPNVNKPIESVKKPPTKDKEEKTEPKQQTPIKEEKQTVAQTTNTNSNEVAVFTPSQEHPQVFSEIDENTIGNPVAKRTEVMLVSKKKMLLLDGNYGQSDGKQLYYSIDLLTGGNTITATVNGVAYEGIKVGDKLKVDYNVYMNDKNIHFPVVMNMEKVE